MGKFSTKLFLLELIILVSFISGCVYDKNVTSTVNALPEVQQFLKDHPDAKIAVTFWSKDEVTNSEQEISQQCDKKIVPTDMFKSTISEGNLKTIVWINAENLTVICSVIEETPVTPSPTSSSVIAPTPSPIITPPSPSSVTSPQPTSIPTASTGTVSVFIKNFAFNPSIITIPVGTTVIWTQMDNAYCTVTGDGFDSGILGQGETYIWTFNNSGTYSYSCSFHSNMTGTVIVTETPSAPSPAPSPVPVSTTIPGAVSVDIKGYAFNPSPITIPTGTTVIWTQMDSVDHTVTGIGFDSGTLGQGQTFRRTFYDAGTYSYSCSIHPTMIGTVIVMGTVSPSPRGTVNNPYMYNIY
ncbi:MAG: cupredoxin domain-containing protein [Candidatus Methanoperedens sp.]|nr:cupredoxin domain-containing protein [Candidatus Methanoperedens sp.]